MMGASYFVSFDYVRAKFKIKDLRLESETFLGLGDITDDGCLRKSYELLGPGTVSSF